MKKLIHFIRVINVKVTLFIQKKLDYLTMNDGIS